MSSITLHPVGTVPASSAARATPSFWQRFSSLYWDGLKLHVHDLDLGAAPAPEGADEALTAEPRPSVPLARVWRGLVRAGDADAFHRYVQTLGAPSYRQARGNLGVWVLRRPLGVVTEFMLISHWESEADVAAYAGGDAAKPRHFAETKRYLLPEGEGVEHFDLLPEAAARYASARY